MKSSSVRTALVALLLLFSCRPASSQSPIRKVLQMLAEMKSTGLQESEAERSVFKEYTDFVHERDDDLKYEIEKGEARAENLEATIAKATSDVQLRSSKISDVDAESSRFEGEHQAATENRASDRAEYEAEKSDHEATLYALDRAINSLSAQNYDRAQAEALLQKSARGRKGMQRVLAALALSDQQQPDGTPQVAGYQFQSGAVIDLLKKLHERFTKELGDLEQQEMNSAHAHEMKSVHVSSLLSNLKSDREEHFAAKANAAQLAASSKGELADLTARLEVAKKSLMDLLATYEAKNATFHANQQVRAEEAEAIETAETILSSPEAAGAYENHVKTFLQLPKASPRGLRLRANSASSDHSPTSFVQVRAVARHTSTQAISEVEKYLRDRASALRSGALAVLADRVTANPFDKVIDMIESLLARLKEDASSEADHKSYCDEELQQNKQKRKTLTSQVATLRASSDKEAATVKTLAGDISQLAQEQAELRKAMSDATDQRSKEKEENLVAIKDSKAAQVAIKQAVAVLKEFYAKQSSDSRFLQTRHGRQVPDMQAYKGMQRTQGGVAGMLEVIESDFARVESETTAAEDQAVKFYTAFMADSETQAKVKRDSEFQLSLDKDQAEFQQEQFEKDLAATSEQLKMAEAYFAELKPQCIEVHVSFEERTARRQEEIEALKQAFKILDSKSQGNA